LNAFGGEDSERTGRSGHECGVARVTLGHG
jgi:hypothetical protein